MKAAGHEQERLFLATVQKKVAVSAAGPSALRGQGVGVVKTAQNFLESLSLARIPRSSERNFQAWLDRQTQSLLEDFHSLPGVDRPWGTARKAINLFLRDALYNRYLFDAFPMRAVEPWLEVALDSTVARGLKNYEAATTYLPRWPGLKHLNPEVSDAYQDRASEYVAAEFPDLARVHLDIFLWLANR